MADNQEIPYFRCVKVLIIVLDILTFIIATCLIGALIVFVVLSNSHKRDQGIPQLPGPSDESSVGFSALGYDQESSQVLMIIGVVVLVIYLLLTSLSIYGVIKENETIILALFIVGIITRIPALISQNMILLFGGILWPFLYIIYYRMLVSKRKKNYPCYNNLEEM